MRYFKIELTRMTLVNRIVYPRLPSLKSHRSSRISDDSLLSSRHIKSIGEKRIAINTLTTATPALGHTHSMTLAPNMNIMRTQMYVCKVM